MSKDDKYDYIPELEFQNRHQKSFDFSIASNKEILSGKLSGGGPNPFLPHRIHYYSILFIIKGQGLHYIDFKSYPYRDGSIIFISREQVQRFERNEAREAYFLVFTKEFLEKSTMGSNLMQELSLYNYHLYPPVLQLPEDLMMIFTELVIRIKQEYDAPDDVFTEELIQSSLKIFLIMAERLRKRKMEARPLTRQQMEFIRFQQLLQEHLPIQRQVQFYADALTISTKKLNRMTQSIMQQTAKSYINEHAVIEMKRLLMNTTLSIKEIAFQTGFEEPTNFVKFFKAEAGMTPIAFRKQYHGKR
jgi:AraC-like DNA-binding protein/quercetin dioxygenase-like cupin family protein